MLLGFENCVEIPSRGIKGGIVMAWKNGVLLDVKFCCDHFVNLVLYSDPSDQLWLLSFVYRPTVWNEKVKGLFVKYCKIFKVSIEFRIFI